jgi:PLP dependent protein
VDQVEGLAGRIAAVRAAIAEAALRAARHPDAVRIVAVTKTLAPAAVAAALAAGLTDIGENYLQEARPKRAAVGAGVWHLIGGLQRNKVRAAVAAFDWIHTLDSVDLARFLAQEVARAGRRLPVLMQVNVAGEVTKRGVRPDEAMGLAQVVLGHEALGLQGLMTIGPQADPARARQCFRGLRELRDTIGKRLGVELPHLSMGMSDDFVIAVEEGATWLRLGRALFGSRSSRTWREGA